MGKDHKIKDLVDAVFSTLMSSKYIGKWIHNEMLYKIVKDINSSYYCSDLSEELMEDRYKKEFKRVCYTIHKEYPDVERAFDDYNNLYLCIKDNITKDFRDTEDVLGTKYVDDSDVEEDKPFDRSYLIDDKFDYDKYDSDEYIDGVDTYTHMMVRYNKSKALDKLLKDSSIDIEKKNKQNKSLIDLANEANNNDLLIKLLKYKYERLLTKAKFEIDDLKLSNKSLKEKNLSLRADNVSLSKSEFKMRSQYNSMIKQIDGLKDDVEMKRKMIYVIVFLAICIKLFL